MSIYRHGGDVYSMNIKYDFSASINPMGMPKSCAEALKLGISRLECYPDTQCRELVKAISKYEKVDTKNILCGNGAADLIYRIAYAIKPKKALLTAPTFSEYEYALRNVECKIIYEMLQDEDNFVLSESVLEKIPDADIFFLCNPNNPVGNTVKSEQLCKIVKKCNKCGTLLIVDECFMDFVTDGEVLSAKKYLDSGVVILRAFTKIFAMAGLRLGYILCADDGIINNIRKSGSCWSVSSAAQIAGAAVACDNEYISKTKDLIASEREFLVHKLNELGMKIFPPEANFIFFKSDIELEKSLLERGIAVRSCDNYVGLDSGFYRVAVRTHEENVILLSEMEKIIYG